jgi:endoglucanase
MDPSASGPKHLPAAPSGRLKAGRRLASTVSTVLALGADLPLRAQDNTPFGINGRLEVCGLNLCNQHGNPIQLRGISTHGLQWYPWGDCLKEASLESLAGDWGADILRVSMYMQEGGWTTDKPRFTAMVDQVIEAATAKGLYVIIDFHQLTPGDPNANLDVAVEYFEIMAPRHGPKGNVFYEICNEPNGVRWSSIKAYADRIIPVIRKHDPRSPILVGTMGWSSLGVSGQGPWGDILAAPIDDPNVLYTFHFYAKDHTDLYRNTFRAASTRLPLFVSEFGTQEASGDGPDDFTSAQAWIDLLAERKVSWVNWNFSDDPRSGAVLKPGTCPNGPWTGGALKEAGAWIQARMSTPDDFKTTPSPVLRKDPSGRSGSLSSALRLASSAGAVRLEVDLQGPYAVTVREADGRVAAELRGNGPQSFPLDRSLVSAGIRHVEIRRGKERAFRVLVF